MYIYLVPDRWKARLFFDVYELHRPLFHHESATFFVSLSSTYHKYFAFSVNREPFRLDIESHNGYET